MDLVRTMNENKKQGVCDRLFSIICGLDCFCRRDSNSFQIYSTRRKWVLVLLIFFMFECYYNVVANYKILQSGNSELNDIDTSTYGLKVTRKADLAYYKYPLSNLSDVSMDYKIGYNSSYYWFTSMKHLFKNLGYEDKLLNPKHILDCELKKSLGPILVNKSQPNLEWVEQQNPDLELGGYHAPAHCRATQRVAIIVSYRNRSSNLAVLLRYIHPLLRRQQLEYRVFVVEQNGTELFNKGTLYNIAFLETQRFGTWDCLIFHDVDLIPEDERISYTCQEHPTHMSASVEAHGYVLAYKKLFGGVTSLTPEQYTAVNGYSNFYWSWGAEDDDMYVRLKSANLPILRYNGSIARYASLPHERVPHGKYRHFFLDHSKLRYRKEGLTSTKYKLIEVNEEKLYTHILADVNPIKMRLDLKSILRQLVYIFDNSLTYAGVETIEEGGILHVTEKKTLCHL